MKIFQHAYYGQATSDEIADLVDDAADYMEKVGSCAGVFNDDSGRVCMEGSIYTLNHVPQVHYESTIAIPSDAAHVLAIDLLCQHCGRKYGVDTTRYNDVANHQQRLDTLREFAKHMRNIDNDT